MPTLSKMLSTIQNRQPLPNGGGLSCGHLHHEHHVFHDRFQIGQGLHLSVRVSVFQSFLQPRKGHRFVTRAGRYVQFTPFPDAASDHAKGRSPKTPTLPVSPAIAVSPGKAPWNRTSPARG
jgi:hypothetical protein